MNKRFRNWIIASAVVMLGLPFLAVAFTTGNMALVICIALFWAINPIFSIVQGYAAGSDVREMWGLPLLNSLLYVAGMWLFFAMGEMSFLLYGLMYMALGYLAMWMMWMVCRRRNR